mmetsp:Transcript_93761/g.260533  ORF Transcript_93761/g.260533 Transcript_93761/m.260533 type:complete len:234 (-) Transcript_93761:221-922(-)
MWDTGRRGRVRELVQLQPSSLDLADQVSMPLQKLRVLANNPAVVRRVQHRELRVGACEDGSAAHQLVVEKGRFAEPRACEDVPLDALAWVDTVRLLLLVRHVRSAVREGAGLLDGPHLGLRRLKHQQAPHDDEDNLLLQLPRFDDEVAGVALHPRVCLRDVRDEGHRGAAKEGEVQHRATQQLYRQLPLHARREPCEQRRGEAQAPLLLQLHAQVVLNAPPQLQGNMPPLHQL